MNDSSNNEWSHDGDTAFASPKAQQMSGNGHQTTGELARSNLAINLARLREMRGMVEKAVEHNDPVLIAFDAGIAKLAEALAALSAQASAN